MRLLMFHGCESNTVAMTYAVCFVYLFVVVLCVYVVCVSAGIGPFEQLGDIEPVS